MNNGNSEAKYNYSQNKFGSELLPDAPEGAWAATIMRGKSKVGPTKNKDPMLSITLRLDRADDVDNESSQGTLLTVRFIFTDDSSKNKWMSNRTKRELNALCGQLGLTPDIYTLSGTSNPEIELSGFIEALEGREVECYTVHRTNKQTGATETNVQFSKPGGYSTASDD